MNHYMAQHNAQSIFKEVVSHNLYKLLISSSKNNCTNLTFNVISIVINNVLKVDYQKLLISVAHRAKVANLK